MSPYNEGKTETVRTRISWALYKKALSKMKTYGSWSEYLRRLIQADCGVKEL